MQVLLKMARSVSRSAARNTESPPQDVEIIDADDTEAESEDEYEVEAIVAHKPLVSLVFLS